MPNPTYTDQSFHVAQPGWRVAWARHIYGEEVHVGMVPLVGWLTQGDGAGHLRVLPVLALTDGTTTALGRHRSTDEVRVLGPEQGEPDFQTLRDGVLVNVKGDTRWLLERDSKAGERVSA